MRKPQRIVAIAATALATTAVMTAATRAQAVLLPVPVSTPVTSVRPTPAKGVSSTTLFDEKLGEVDVIVKQITIQPGGYTTWHYHPNSISGVVQQGQLSHYDAKCRPDGPHGRPYKQGDVIIEPGGSGHIHIGRNEGKTPVILDVTYYVPTGSQPAVDVRDPKCHLP